MTSPARLLSLDDPSENFPHFLQIGRLGGEPERSGLSVDRHRVDRLADLMGDRGRQLPHRRDAIDMSQFRLRFAVSPLALAQVLLCQLTLGQIEHEGDALLLRPHRMSLRPRRIGTRLPSLRRYSFSKDLRRFPFVLTTARARSLTSSHSDGVSPGNTGDPK